MNGCHNCGRPYDDSFADWTICRECKMQLEHALKDDAKTLIELI